MRIFRGLVACLSVLALAPLAAQQNDRPTEPPASSAPSSPQQGAPELSQLDVETWLDGLMPYAIERGKIAGAEVVVVKDGQVLTQKGYGFSDLAKRTPVDPETTLFRPGSISKLFTWTAVMQQVEAGKLDLDADVNTYLDFRIPPYQGKPVTLRNIMTHTAGFEESVRFLIGNDPKALMPLSDYVKRALPARVFAPGTTPAYSNYATALAGYIVERVSGVPFDDYIEQNIFQPLGMQHSTFRQPLPAALADDMSKGYPTDASPPRPFEIVFPAPAGSLSASGADMAKFMIAHLADGAGLLRPETAREMHDYRAPGIGPLNVMALGFYEQVINGHRAIGHGGDTGLFHSDLMLFPKENIGLYISMNSRGEDATVYRLRSYLMRAFVDRYLPDDRQYSAIDAATARQHAQMVAGTYVSSRGSFTNFMSVFGLLGGTKVEVGPDGKIQIPDLDILTPGTRNWVEIAPFVWRDATSGERFAATVENGRVERVSLDSVSPFMILTPASFGTSPAVWLPLLSLALGLVLLAAIAWPVRALVRRRFKAEFGLTGTALRTCRLTRGFAWAVLVAVAGWAMLVMAFQGDSGALGGGLDWLLTLLRILTPVASIGLLVTSAWFLTICFRERRAWTMKLGAALLVLAALVLVYVTFRFHLYGFGMVF